MQHDPEELCISAITMAELEFGVSKSSRPAQNRMALIAFLSRIRVLPFDADAAREYGDIRQDLTQKGSLIGANDLLIAAHARALGLTLVTNNTREFERVERLTLENWVEE
jgi:tRNA(fMet)-specific endonuclease VapC